ncbi:inositol monophosphatase [bacterium]|nr:inositol monophosphatase [bacterium]
MLNDSIRKIAIKTAVKAGRMLEKRFLNFDRKGVKFKSGHEILTLADLESEKIILGIIKKEFSDHRILSEESGENKKDSDYLWIVDPLDGTTNFSMHNPLFSVSIGICYKNDIILGVIYFPVLNELYVAERNKGAKIYCPYNSSRGKKMKVSNIKEGNIINTFCHGRKISDIKRASDYHKRQKLDNFDCRQLGSAAIELAYVACGRVESIFIPGAHSWDVAAGVTLVREAGGRVSDANGKDWTLQSNDILASNGLVHDQILKKIKK